MKFKSVDFLVGCFGISIVISVLNKIGIVNNLADLIGLCAVGILLVFMLVAVWLFYDSFQNCG
jgi:hypothetical protein